MESVEKKINAVLKQAGFTSLTAYLIETGITPAKVATPAKATTLKPTKTATQPKAKKGKAKVKRARITDEQIAQMKELRTKKGLSFEAVADKVGTSPMSVLNYEKAGFKRS